MLFLKPGRAPAGCSNGAGGVCRGINGSGGMLFSLQPLHEVVLLFLLLPPTPAALPVSGSLPPASLVLPLPLFAFIMSLLISAESRRTGLH